MMVATQFRAVRCGNTGFTRRPLRLVLALTLSLVAVLNARCRPAQTSQERYSYPGCEDAGSYNCPNLLVFACALRTIEERHSSCSVDADCEAVELRNCVGVLTGCPPAAVRADARGQFLQEADAEANRYCGEPACVSASSCGESFAARRTRCTAGRCRAVSDAFDGGGS